MKAPALLGYRILPEIPVSQALSAMKEPSSQQSKMADPHGLASGWEPSLPAISVFGAHAPLAVSAAFSPSSLPYIPPCLIAAECLADSQCLSWMSHSSCNGEELKGLLQELMAFLHLLPTKLDLEHLLLAGDRGAAQGGREEMSALTTDQDYSEPRQEANPHMLVMADCSQASQPAHVRSLALSLEDMDEEAPLITTEIADLSEAPGPGESQDTILSFSNKVLLSNPLALFNVTSALKALELWPRGLFKSRDANILLQQSCAPHPLEFVRPPGYTLPDHPRATLQSRAILKPPLLKLREDGATYRWGILYYLSPVAADFGHQSPPSSGRSSHTFEEISPSRRVRPILSNGALFAER